MFGAPITLQQSPCTPSLPSLRYGDQAEHQSTCCRDTILLPCDKQEREHVYTVL